MRCKPAWRLSSIALSDTFLNLKEEHMNIKKVGVAGCGLMGAGIAQVAAQAGYGTIVRELNEELLGKEPDRISAFLDKGVAKKKLTQAKRGFVD